MHYTYFAFDFFAVFLNVQNEYVYKGSIFQKNPVRNGNAKKMTMSPLAVPEPFKMLFSDNNKCSSKFHHSFQWGLWISSEGYKNLKVF